MFQTHCSLCSFLNVPGKLLPHILFTYCYLCPEHAHPDTYMTHSLTFFRSLLKCHFIGKVFHAESICSTTPVTLCPSVLFSFFHTLSLPDFIFQISLFLFSPLECNIYEDRDFFLSCSYLYAQLLELCLAHNKYFVVRWLNEWTSEWVSESLFHLARLWVYGKSQRKLPGCNSAYSAHG